VSSTFPRVRKSARGYDPGEVEDFLEDARRAYATDPAQPALLTSEAIRRQSFSMRKGGYSAAAVDSALERLEDAFATRERARVVAQQGEQAWYGQARGTAQSILDRLVRPRGKRFRRLSIFTVGYSVREVDAITDRIGQYFQSGKALTVQDVRSSAFHAQRGGYSEAQVDVLLDAVVDVMLSVRSD